MVRYAVSAGVVVAVQMRGLTPPPNGGAGIDMMGWCLANCQIHQRTQRHFYVSKSKPRPKVLSEEDKKRRFSLMMATINGIRITCIVAIIAGAFVASVYCGIYLPIKETAGETTFISYTVNFLWDIKFHIWAAWGAAASCAGWAIWEKRSRIKERGEKDARISELEEFIDPLRTSSELTPAGEKRK